MNFTYSVYVTWYFRYFEYVVDLLIVVNAGCITANFQVVEYIFLPLFTVEIMLRIYTLSPRRYFALPYGGLNV